jgi:hypothetical protein
VDTDPTREAGEAAVSRSLGPALAMSGITLFNDIIVHGLDAKKEGRVIVAGLIVTGSLALLENVSPDLAVGIAWLGLIGVLLVRTQPGVPAPLEAFSTWYNAK